MPIDEEREFVLTVDSVRTITIVPATDDSSFVLTVEDPHSVAVVEITPAELAELTEAMQKLVKA